MRKDFRGWLEELTDWNLAHCGTRLADDDGEGTES